MKKLPEIVTASPAVDNVIIYKNLSAFCRIQYIFDGATRVIFGEPAEYGIILTMRQIEVLEKRDG